MRQKFAVFGRTLEDERIAGTELSRWAEVYRLLLEDVGVWTDASSAPSASCTRAQWLANNDAGYWATFQSGSKGGSPTSFSIAPSTPADVQAAINALPMRLDADCYVTLPAGTITSTVDVCGFTGSGTLHLTGATTAASPTTGVASGAAGAGTSATSLVKPTGAANWTSSDSALLGKFVKVTSGTAAGTASAPTLCPITGVSTTTLSIDCAGLAAGDTFELVDLATIIASTAGAASALRVNNNACAVVVHGVKFNPAASYLGDALASSACADVTYDGCKFSGSPADCVVRIQHSHRQAVTNSVFLSGSTVSVTTCNYLLLKNVYNSGGGVIYPAFCNAIDVYKYRCISGTGSAFQAAYCQSIRAEVYASSCASTPVVLDSIDSFTAWGSLLLSGTNASAPYGITMDKAGRYNLTGATITGAADFAINGTAGTWANMSSPSYGAYGGFGVSAFGSASPTKAILGGNYFFSGALDFNSRCLFYGYINQSFPLTAQTATGSSASDALDLSSSGRGGAEFGTVAAGTGCKLPSGCAIAGVLVTIVNRGVNALTIYPPTGGSINGGSSTSLPAGKAMQFVSLNGHSGTDFWIVAGPT